MTVTQALRHGALAMLIGLGLHLTALVPPAQAETTGVRHATVRDSGIELQAACLDMLDPAADDFTPTVEIRAGGRRLHLARFPGETGCPSLFVTEMDPANGKPEAVVEFYSGGAHCCESIYVLEEVPGRPGRWQKVDLGQHDGGERLPQDLDGDGLSEIVTKDESFLYAYGSYGESYAPPVIVSVRQGRRVDLTRSPAMRPDLRKEERRVLKMMRDPDRRTDNGYIPNGVLAGYVALKLLLGEGREGWLFMLKNRDPAAPPERMCPLEENEVGECPVPRLKVPFPVMLTFHLRAAGYVGGDAEDAATDGK